ncbi:MAG: hypothetical protein DRH08_13580 [Deltaproteobacteria bacterium]|nr:MAG: hypothetical protein DRH08_13580 [Deltaproteobacteria bacterium]
MSGVLDLTGLVQIENIRLRLDVKIKKDSGNLSASSGDVGGTQVSFAQNFIDVRSILLTPKFNVTNGAMTAIYDFVDIPNPTEFFVYLYRTSDGLRVSGEVSWQAEGF